jgi:predicted transcriptional regulator
MCLAQYLMVMLVTREGALHDRLSSIGHQMQTRRHALNAPNLANLRSIKAHELRLLAIESGEQHLARLGVLTHVTGQSVKGGH